MTSYSNGRFPAGALAPIRGGRLRKDAAAAFDAMDAEAVHRFGRHIGVNDSYRILGAPGDLARGRWSQWMAWERYLHGGNLAAHPGTSNHGWGLAVDLTPDGIQIVHAIGHRYGWAKEWSDAPSENWHFRWRPGVWDGHGAQVDPLKGLTKPERKMADQLHLHRAGMAREAKSGRGPKWHAHLKWARWWKEQIRRHMHALYADAHKPGAGGWKKNGRGRRYQLLAHVYEGKA
jgi:hypothetical protein